MSWLSESASAVCVDLLFRTLSCEVDDRFQSLVGWKKEKGSHVASPFLR